MPKKIDEELKARAIRLVNDHQGEYSSLTAAATVVAKQLGVGNALRDSSELLAGLNFQEPKRIVVDELVDRLVAEEDRWQQVTLRLMVEIGEMTRFPNLETQRTGSFRLLARKRRWRRSVR